ncbi:response regulator [Streptomyces sp. RLB3-17]|uniref:P-loop NTPase fold protein n=1 Tax=unclassified Streptomyces TaxID=2593676 RepID=UPI0011627093|nr:MULTISPECIES: P-loop NTPase fold protein [unclassified Streptomyces]QDN93506.1 response regulator [Streptomyces sp. RLB3-6]QDO05106.1 response regulator [Streptomyces sp. S1D4-23]QDO45793.1 response regulator [Streptomyces sp. RLB3-17]
MEFSLLNDEPVSEPDGDLLGVGRAAGELARLLHDSRNSTPFTLAVDAGWGMGKSSLMRLVEAELHRRSDTATVWYNAWTSTGADALEGLIKSVLMRFDRRVLRRALNRLTERRTLITAARTAITAAAAPLGVAGLVDRLWQELSVDATTRNAMRDALRELATEWAESATYVPRRLLVVFVDDLDRCSEETVLAVCEAVKVYLDVPGLAFVVGCDRSALGPSGLLRDLSPAGSAFMEKIFQTSYRLPAPGHDDVEVYVRRCALRSGLRELLDNDLVKLIAERSARNPRRIKRLINGFGLEYSLNPVWARFAPEAVIRTLLLQHLYADFYRTLITSDRNHPDAAREFLDYRRAHRVLSRPSVPPDPEDWRITVSCVSEHGLSAPVRDQPEEWKPLLARLEEYLPTGFPALERDHTFVTLLQELMDLDGADELLRLLKHGVASVTGAYPGEERLAPDEESPSPSTRYTGAHVLWVDDNPDGISFHVGLLESLGVRVWLALDEEEAERVLASTRVDLLLSDIARSQDGDEGFVALRHWRDSGRYLGPAVFYTGRITPNRVKQSNRLGAQITTSSTELTRMVHAFLQAAQDGRAAD